MTGHLHNFMVRPPLGRTRPHEGDHVGRAAWALGEVVAIGALPARRVGGPAAAASWRRRLTSLGLPRAHVAFARARTRPPQPGSTAGRELTGFLRELAHRLVDGYAGVRDPGGAGSSTYLTYDNARLPQALLLAGRRLTDDGWSGCGLADPGLVRSSSAARTVSWSGWSAIPWRLQHVPPPTAARSEAGTRVTNSRWTPPPWSRRCQAVVAVTRAAPATPAAQAGRSSGSWAGTG